MKKFYQLSVEQRINKLLENKTITESVGQLLKESIKENDVENTLSENVVGKFTLPFSIIESAFINKKEYLIPMSTEEPSVVAAAANGIKRINNCGGFETTIMKKQTIGQIVWQNKNPIDLANKLTTEKKYINQLVTKSRPSLIKRGGGLADFEINVYDQYVELLLFIDTVDAMGANIVNSICEDIAKQLDDKYSLEHLIAILSNDGSKQLITTSVNLDFEQLSTKDLSGKEVAFKITELSEFTKLSKYRAATNNKGILNGVFAVVNVTGNDNRAVTAALMNYAHEVNSLSSWEIINGKLHGELTLPLPLGSVGGAITSLPMAKLAMNLLKVEDVKELMSVAASVGLANNLSAMRALTTEGIQLGHMKLQSKSLAISAGASDDEVNKVSERLNELQKFNLQAAQEILKELRNS